MFARFSTVAGERGAGDLEKEISEDLHLNSILKTVTGI